MAKKLNKKVALIGTVVFVFLAMAAIAVILYLSKDPEKFIRDGDAALLAKDYKTAERNYHRARNWAKTDSLRIEMLFKLADLYITTGEWRNVMGCWSRIIQIEPKNVKARYKRLRYIDVAADSGLYGLWPEAESQASEFIEVAKDANLLDEDTAQWETAAMPASKMHAKKLGPYLYLLRGRAFLEKEKRGGTTDPDELLARVIGDLEKVLELQPDNVNAYWYLTQAVVAKGEIYASRGNLEERGKAIEQARKYLEKAVEVAGNDVEAHINLLTLKPVLAQMTGREQLQTLEPEYLSLVEKFSSSGRSQSALAEFYVRLGYKSLDKAIEHIEKAIELDKENISYAMAAARLHYRKFSIYKKNEELTKAIEIARNALVLPDAKETKGPREWANKNNRVWLYGFLSRCYIEQVLEPYEVRTEADSQKWMADAEKAVHEIEQLYGSGEEPQVIKWRGMLELAKGNRDVAIRKLNTTYEQLKAAGQRDMLLSYALAKLFAGTDELGAVADFFGSALSVFDRSVPDKIDDDRPESLLEYADVLLKLRAYDVVLNVVNFFESEYWSNKRSQALRMAAYISARQLDQAEKELAKIQPDETDAVKFNLALTRAKIDQIRRAIAQRKVEEEADIVSQQLKAATKESALPQGAGAEGSAELMSAELQSYNDTMVKLAEKLLAVEPNSVPVASIALACDNYIVENRIDTAKTVIDKYLQYFPKNTTALSYKKLLSEPKPAEVSVVRRREIEKDILANVTEPIDRALWLGAFYNRSNEPNKAAEEFRKIVDIKALRQGVVEDSNTAAKLTNAQNIATVSLADIALKTKDWRMAEQIANIGKRANLDGCEGKFFAAVVAMIKGDYKTAEASVTEGLKLRPVFSYGFLFRSNVNTLLGNERAAVEDAQKAAFLNPLDGDIAKNLASVLYSRNQKLGDNASSAQLIEARTALDRAMALNPGDLQLLNFYAEYVSSTEPERALAIRQNLQKVAPSLQNAVFLGRTATKMARDEINAERKKALFTIAASAFEQARAYDPKDETMLDGFSEYYRLTGQEEKAKALLKQSQKPKLLWRHYYKLGQLKEATEVLEQLYKSDANDSDTIKGFLLVAQSTTDGEAAKKYSEALLTVENNVENRLLQIQTFLIIGLVKEAEYKLQSFNEKYPNEPRAMLLEAWLAMKQGKLEKALELVNRNLETNQDNAVAWRLRGEVNYLLASYDQAISDLKKSKAISDKPAVRITLAKACLRAGRGEDAITELETLMDSPQAPMEGLLLLEQIYQLFKKEESLNRLYDNVLKNFPDNLLWYDRAGKFALSKGDFSRAEQLYEQAWQKSGDSYQDALDGYFMALLGAGKPDRVLEEGVKYVDSGFAPLAYFRMAEAKFKMGDRTAAGQYCRKAVDKARLSENATSWVLQKMYFLLGPEEVAQVCKERLEADPNSFAANHAMFNLANFSGEYNKALSYIDRCMEIIGPNTERLDLRVQKAEVLQSAYSKTSDNSYLDKAVAEYESLLPKMPNNTGVLNNLAYMLAEANIRLAEAVEYAKRAYDANPNDPGLLDTYGYVLYKNGEYSKSVELLQSAVQQFERGKASVPADIYMHLGMVKEALNETVQARAAYGQALEAGKDTLSEAVKKRLKAAIERLSQ